MLSGIAAVFAYLFSFLLPNTGGSDAFTLALADILKVIKAGALTAAAAFTVYCLGQLQLLDKTNPVALIAVTLLVPLLTGLQRYLTDTKK